MGNKSGKTLTFVLVIFIILAISVAGIAVFYLLKEIDRSQSLSLNVDQLKQAEAKIQSDLKSAQEQITLLEEKKKDAEGKIENLMQEVDLQRTTKEQVQKDNETLQSNLQKETQEKENLRARLMQDIKKGEERIAAMQSELDKVMKRNKELEAAKAQVTSKLESAGEATSTASEETSPNESGVPLGKIVVNPSSVQKGRVISVDSDTDFVIVSLGEKDGLSKGAILSLYRDQEYLGDVKVSRVLTSMSAADFVPPLKSQNVKKDDSVVIKK